MTLYYTYDEQEAQELKQYFEKQGYNVVIIPIADEFRKFGDPRPVKVKYFIRREGRRRQ